ncbi:MAG: hypothetical protein F4X97_07545, partial [Boseongicola sp. SB0662_bin_57]|nr:hypothetical protein [Boseongicola sp. SB0662_bin_57]
MTGPMRELQFLAKDRAALLWLGMAVLVAGLSVLLGLREVAAQRTALNELSEIDRAEREVLTGLYQDWG